MSRNDKACVSTIPEPLSPQVRLRKVRALHSILPSLGVSIAPGGNGTVNVQLPAEVAELFIEDLDKRAQEWQEAMRNARLQEIQQNADRKAAIGEGRRQLAAREDAWAEEYQRLRAEGTGHREALHIIRGPQERDAVLITDLERGIQESMARSRRRHREARDAEVCRLAKEGLSGPEIADALRLLYPTVKVILKKAGVSIRDARHDRRGAIGAREYPHSVRVRKELRSPDRGAVGALKA